MSSVFLTWTSCHEIIHADGLLWCPARVGGLSQYASPNRGRWREAGKEEEPVQRWVTESSPSNGYRLLDSMESSSHYMKYSTEISVQGKRRSLHLLASSNHGP